MIRCCLDVMVIVGSGVEEEEHGGSVNGPMTLMVSPGTTMSGYA